MDCALVDRGAVGGGTSQWSTKLLHGGIRYLATGDIAQMREGLRERAAWVRIAPRRCRWEAFWMPHEGLLEGLSHRIGIGLYDHWGSDRPGWPADLRLGGVPRDRFEADPRARGGPFRGAVAYADLLTWDRALVGDLAASSAARKFDFHDVEGWSDRSGQLLAARLRDRRDGTARTLAADHWVFALGPWTDPGHGRLVPGGIPAAAPVGGHPPVAGPGARLRAALGHAPVGRPDPVRHPPGRPDAGGHHRAGSG